MSTYYIVRNGADSGPYTPQVLQHYVQSGHILLQDAARNAAGGTETSVRKALAAHGLKAQATVSGGPWQQIKALGSDLLFPAKLIFSRDAFRDQRLLLVAIIGLAPILLINFTPGTLLTFYTLALYFSLLWGLFFFYIFRTPQVEYKKALIAFASTQLVIAIAVFVPQLRLMRLNPFSTLADSSSFVLRIIGFVVGVGVFEETIKAIPVYLIGRRSRTPLIPQTMVFYGLMSGIAFGTFEGVLYQLTRNVELDYRSAYFANIARLTSLPFLHAIWAGIAGYFLSLSFLYPRNRYALRVLAIAVPAILHGVYDVFTWSLPGIAVCIISVVLLMLYLKRSKDFAQRLGR